jgi:hypothetical protein
MNKNCSTLLEYFPNELFNGIFSYLNGIDGIYAFSYLNYRFQCLLFNYHYQSFDFTSINKHKFDIVFQFFDAQQCKSFNLSNDDYTYGQIDYFFQNYSLIQLFSQLESLSIVSLKSLNESLLLSQLPFLSNLVSLTLKPICGEKMSEFNLPNLKKFVFGSCTNTNWIRVRLSIRDVRDPRGKKRILDPWLLVDPGGSWWILMNSVDPGECW